MKKTSKLKLKSMLKPRKIKVLGDYEWFRDKDQFMPHKPNTYKKPLYFGGMRPYIYPEPFLKIN